MQSQAFGARYSWQVTGPEAAGATTRACAAMHIAKGFPADEGPGSDRYEKWNAMPTLLLCSCSVCSVRGHNDLVSG